jgi:hypothetical protein
VVQTLLIGMAGLGTEIPYPMFKHRQTQTAADSAFAGMTAAEAIGRIRTKR